jgi:hypothetical protein
MDMDACMPPIDQQTNKRKRNTKLSWGTTPTKTPNENTLSSPSPTHAPYQLSTLLSDTEDIIPPSSPTRPPTGSNPKKCRTTHDTPEEQALISPPSPPTIPPTIITSTPMGQGVHTTGQEQPATIQNPPPNNLVEQNPVKNAEMLARLTATSGRNITKTHPPGNAQDKYLSATTPIIYDEHPLGLLEGIAPEQVEAWLEIKTASANLQNAFPLSVTFSYFLACHKHTSW